MLRTEGHFSANSRRIEGSMNQLLISPLLMRKIMLTAGITEANKCSQKAIIFIEIKTEA